MSNIPKVRFSGFSEDWKQCKIKKCATFSKGSGYSKADIQDKGTPLILYGRLYTKYETVIKNLDTFTTPKEGSVYSHGNEVIVPASGETAEDISIASAVKEAGILLGGDLNIVIPNTEIDPAFLALSISHGKTHRDLSKRAQGKSVVHIHNSDIQSVELRFPEKIEQEKISGLFVDLDNFIALHQREYEKLVALKAACLDKMFPKNGSKVPEMRFAGFAGDWQQCKLGDEATEIVAGGDIDKSLLDVNGKYPVIANALTNDGIVGYYADEYRIKAPAVTVTGRGDVGHAKARLVDFTPIVRLLSIRTEHDVLFLENAINTLSIIIESTGVPQLTVPQLARYKLSFPPTLDEEKAIGRFFGDLDNLIFLHQRKLDKLKQIKQAMLHNMFV